MKKSELKNGMLLYVKDLECDIYNGLENKNRQLFI